MGILCAHTGTIVLLFLYPFAQTLRNLLCCKFILVFNKGVVLEKNKSIQRLISSNVMNPPYQQAVEQPGSQQSWSQVKSNHLAATAE